MNDTRHWTDTLGTVKAVICGPQKTHFVEFQLVDEQGEPLANMPYRAVNDATRADCAPQYAGVSDAEGVIRVEGLHPLDITLLVQADPLAEVLQTRRLRAIRAEPPLPHISRPWPLHGPQRSGFSPVEKQALAAGHSYHYLRIGQLCDQAPTFEPPLADPEQLPAFHFPDPEFSGFTVVYEELNRRHVLEVCPLRAWSLVLHHQAEYSLVNAYNLGLMSLLAYSRSPKTEEGSVEHFFLQQCLDLSRTPRIWDRQNWPCVVTDVPFHDRYLEALMRDTHEANLPEGDTQFFYAINATQVLVGWRGTASWADVVTDVTFRPVESPYTASCELKVLCEELSPAGSVHLGFREGFEVARRIYAGDLDGSIPKEAVDKELFICGHSLGGALGLIHAASQKHLNPLLYTYGMPRTFTLKAVQNLGNIWHCRHVNDTDTIPSVPFEAELDNYFYNIYGCLGTLLGFTWSLAQVAASGVLTYGDPYCHHGDVAIFYRADQHLRKRASEFHAQGNKEGLGAPRYTIITRRLPVRTKLFLVPSLGPEADEQAKSTQVRLMGSLTAQQRESFFPRYKNPKKGDIFGAGNHSMLEYLPYVHNQLLESLNPSRDPLLERQEQRKQFTEQLKKHYLDIHEEERERNGAFLELQGLLDQTLVVTRDVVDGMDALLRFDSVADPKAFYEKIYG